MDNGLIMDIVRSFTFIFSEKQWAQKVLIGSMLLMMCIFIFPIPLFVGYLAETLKNSAKRQKDILPSWNKVFGLYATGIQVLMILISYFIVYYVLITLLKMIPSFPPLYFILQTIFSFILPVPIIFFATSGEFKKAYEFPKMASFIIDNFWSLLAIWLVGIFLVCISLSGMTVLLIGIAVTTFYAFLVRVHLYGNLVRTKKRVKQTIPK
jgi:hypothetical protein